MSERVHLVSLGCPKNRVDSEVMIGKLRGADCELVDSPDEADVIVVNTCSFIQPATEESIDTVLEMAGYKESGNCEKLIVTGCMVQRFGNALEDELPEVDHFLGTGEYHRIDEVLKSRDNAAPKTHIDVPMYIHDEFAPRVNSWKGHSAWLKISEGCNHRCAFCIIGFFRAGPPLSNPYDTQVQQREHVSTTLLFSLFFSLFTFFFFLSHPFFLQIVRDGH